jgi:hypothetical protein
MSNLLAFNVRLNPHNQSLSFIALWFPLWNYLDPTPKLNIITLVLFYFVHEKVLVPPFNQTIFSFFEFGFVKMRRTAPKMNIINTFQCVGPLLSPHITTHNIVTFKKKSIYPHPKQHIIVLKVYFPMPKTAH